MHCGCMLDKRREEKDAWVHVPYLNGGDGGRAVRDASVYLPVTILRPSSDEQVLSILIVYLPLLWFAGKKQLPKHWLLSVHVNWPFIAFGEIGRQFFSSLHVRRNTCFTLVSCRTAIVHTSRSLACRYLGVYVPAGTCRSPTAVDLG